MHEAGLLALLPQALAGVFAAAGALHVAGPGWLRQTYERWDYPARFRFVAGTLNVAAAVLLLAPETRGWGIALAAAISFFAVVALLDHEKYLLAVPSMILMAALVPAMLSLPPPDHYAHYAVEGPALLSRN